MGFVEGRGICCDRLTVHSLELTALLEGLTVCFLGSVVPSHPPPPTCAPKVRAVFISLRRRRVFFLPRFGLKLVITFIPNTLCLRFFLSPHAYYSWIYYGMGMKKVVSFYNCMVCSYSSTSACCRSPSRRRILTLWWFDPFTQLLNWTILKNLFNLNIL